VKIVYDATLRRPGCVLLQALMGGTVPNFTRLFTSESWLVERTPDMRVYEVTPAQLPRLVAITEAALQEKR
jgi:hypothetical protein